LLRSLQEIQPVLMEEDCGGLSWAVEPMGEREYHLINALEILCSHAPWK
jgi:hypothetical protein